VQSHERAVSADASIYNAREYDERSPRHYRKTGSSKAVAWGSPTGRFKDTDPKSHFYQGVKSELVQEDSSDSTRDPKSSAASRPKGLEKGVAWGAPTSHRFDQKFPSSYLHTGAASHAVSPAQYNPPVRSLTVDVLRLPIRDAC
jgi:hypothetical protein